MRDIASLSRPELLELRSQVHEAIENAFAREKKQLALASAERAAATHGFFLSDLVNPSHPSRHAKLGLTARYRNPGNSTETWTGRGWPPRWIIDSLTAGGDLSELEC